MKLTTIGLALIASLALSAGSALAQMQPIPNPPEKPAATMHHAKKHHAKKHHAKKHHAAKKAAASTTPAPAAAPSEAPKPQ